MKGRALIAVLLGWAAAMSASAQNPWQQDTGEYLFSPYVSYYTTDELRTSDGDRVAFNNNGSFTSVNYRLYFSMPIRNYKWNFFGTVPYFQNTYEENAFTNTNNDWGDLELGIRAHLAEFETHYLMAAVIGYAPIYTNDTEPYTGFEKWGVEPRLIYAGYAPWLRWSNFHRLELGVRQFFSDPTQIRVYASHGIDITKRLFILNEIDAMFSFSNLSDFDQQNLRVVTDFQFAKAVMSLGVRINPKWQMYGGLFHDFYNRNVAIGKGAQFALVFEL